MHYLLTRDGHQWQAHALCCGLQQKDLLMQPSFDSSMYVVCCAALRLCSEVQSWYRGMMEKEPVAFMETTAMAGECLNYATVHYSTIQYNKLHYTTLHYIA